MSVQESKNLLASRKRSGFALLFLFACVGLPLWYKFTNVYRAVLPVEYIESLHNDHHQDIHLSIPVYLDTQGSAYHFPDLVDAVQVQVDHALLQEEWDLEWSLQILALEQDSQVNEIGDYIVKLELDGDVGCSLAYDTKTTSVFFTDESVASNDLPFFIAQSLMKYTFRTEFQYYQKEFQHPTKNRNIQKTKSLAIDYSPKVHIAISLLSGGGVPVGWDIEPVLSELFTPFRKFLSPIVNFTVDTDVIYYNDLNLHKLSELDHSVTEHDISTIIDLSELTSTNNYYPGEINVINLAILFPEEDLPESFFANSTETMWQSYLVPQWGSLFINEKALSSTSGNQLTYEYLRPIIYKFSNELFPLLGLSKYEEAISTPLLTIDAFKRTTTIYNNMDKSIETLMSIVQMTEKLPEMAIPREVSRYIESALNLRVEIIDIINNPQSNDWTTALKLSNEFKDITEKAFFHKDMVQENFVPQEHKIAVYLPLLGPVSLVCLSGFLKLWKEKSSTEETTPEDEKKKQ